MTTQTGSVTQPQGMQSSRGGWLAITAYAGLLVATQVLWLTYAPITSEAHVAFGVSEGLVGDLAVVIPILFVALGLPSGRWLDSRFTATMAVGTALTIVGALVRAISVDNYLLALTGQIILGAGQPLLVNGITKLPARHFHPEQRVRAISLLITAQVLGILAASSTGSWLFSRGGLGLVVGVHAALAILAGAAMLASLTIPPRFSGDDSTMGRISLRGNRQMWLLAAQGFIALGLFDVLATWLDSIQSKLGNPGLGGPLITVMTIAGIAGAAVVPTLAARHWGRRRVLIGIGLSCTLATPLLLIVREPIVLVLIIAFVGFLLISALPIVLDWSQTLVGREHAGAAAAFILMVANLGAVLYVVIVQVFIHEPIRAVLVLTLLLVPWAVVAYVQNPDPPLVMTDTADMSI